MSTIRFNSVALRKAKIVYNFGFSECNRVNKFLTKHASKSWAILLV